MQSRLKPPLYLFLSAIGYVVVVYLIEQHILSGAIPLFDDRPKIPVFLNALMLLASLSIMHLFIKRTSIALLMTLALIVPMTIAHLLKLSFRREPLTPSDLVLGKEALDLGKNFLTLEIVTSFALFAFVVIGGCFYLRSYDLVAKRRTRATLFASSATLISLILFLPQAKSEKEILSTLNLQNVVKEPVKTLGQNGFVMDFLLKLRADLNEKTPPPGYNMNELERIVQSLQQEHQNPETLEKPNVIIYVMESFTDPLELGIKTKIDPIPNFRSLAKLKSGRLITPAFGGNTNNVEFEVLTGFSIKAQSRQTGPFHHYVHHNIPALPRVFASNGYRAHAVHPYYGWYWSRHISYPFLGFEKFYDDKSFVNPNKVGNFISDFEVVDKIKSITSDAEENVFIFALTVAGHGPYDWHANHDHETLIKDSVPLASQNSVETYLELVSHADKALGELVKHFSQQKKPTIIVAFGDHLPPLGSGFYSSTGILANQTTEFSDVHYVVWTNYPINYELPQTLPSYALGGEILRMSGMSPEPLFTLANRIGRAHPHYTGPSPNGLDTHVSDYRMLQYDLLLGEKHNLKLVTRQSNKLKIEVKKSSGKINDLKL